MQDLSNHLLKQAYNKAIELKLQEDFIQLIKQEMKKRNLQSKD